MKALGASRYDDPDLFYMSLEEARELISDKYEELADRHERRRGRRVSKPSQG
jgi:hypothetical protein